jgi:hypothetical protein
MKSLVLWLGLTITVSSKSFALTQTAATGSATLQPPPAQAVGGTNATRTNAVGTNAAGVRFGRTNGGEAPLADLQSAPLIHSGNQPLRTKATERSLQAPQWLFRETIAFAKLDDPCTEGISPSVHRTKAKSMVLFAP